MPERLWPNNADIDHVVPSVEMGLEELSMVDRAIDIHMQRMQEVSRG